MSIIKVRGLSHVAFQAPDLLRMRSFLEDFGLQCAADGEVLFMTGCGAAPFLHRTTLGPPAFVALGLEAQSLDDLGRLSAAVGHAPQMLDAPGGGWGITLTDPDGVRVEVVAGRKERPAQLPAGQTWNRIAEQPRLSRVKRVTVGASHAVRLGHCVLGVEDFRRSERWYKDHFGLLTSDEIELRPGEAMGAFLRCDLGCEPTDHHTLFLAQTQKGAGFRHAAFEVVDLDDLMSGRDHLGRKGHGAAWGVGRHMLGSQVFDYWRDPWGHMLEHWTDGDLLTADDPPQVVPISALHDVQWGQEFPGF